MTDPHRKSKRRDGAAIDALSAALAAIIGPIVRDAVLDAVGALDDDRARPANDDGLLDRAGAAKYLRVSLSKLDLLCRDERDPLPYTRVGDARRFAREQLRAWAMRQAGRQ